MNSKKINSAFNKVSRAVHKFAELCEEEKSPIRGISFQVDDEGYTKLRVRYKRLDKKAITQKTSPNVVPFDHAIQKPEGSVERSSSS